MTYKNIKEGIFLSRPNRFVALVEMDGCVNRCHVKNTGRCKELLIPGARVFLNASANPARSTKFDLVAVLKGSRLINMDSYAPNLVFGEYLRQGNFLDGITYIKPESKYGDSRFDFYVEASHRKIFMEVKGVTLEENNLALFPDAPTLRGIKHLNELARCVELGYEAFVIFVIQMKGTHSFSPNNKTHPQFGAALSAAVDKGVTALAFDCLVTPDTLTINRRVPIKI